MLYTIKLHNHDCNSSWEHSCPVVKKCLPFAEPGMSEPYSEATSTEPCPEPHESSPRPCIVLLRLILILYFYLCPNLPSDLIFSGFRVFYVIGCVTSGFCHGINGISACRSVVIYRRFGTNYRSQCLTRWRNKYQPTLRNIAEGRKPRVMRSFYYASQSTNTNDRRHNPHSSFSQMNR